MDFIMDMITVCSVFIGVDHIDTWVFIDLGWEIHVEYLHLSP